MFVKERYQIDIVYSWVYVQLLSWILLKSFLCFISGITFITYGLRLYLMHLFMFDKVLIEIFFPLFSIVIIGLLN